MAGSETGYSLPQQEVQQVFKASMSSRDVIMGREASDPMRSFFERQWKKIEEEEVYSDTGEIQLPANWNAVLGQETSWVEANEARKRQAKETAIDYRVLIKMATVPGFREDPENQEIIQVAKEKIQKVRAARGESFPQHVVIGFKYLIEEELKNNENSKRRIENNSPNLSAVDNLGAEAEEIAELFDEEGNLVDPSHSRGRVRGMGERGPGASYLERERDEVLAKIRKHGSRMYFANKLMRIMNARGRVEYTALSEVLESPNLVSDPERAVLSGYQTMIGIAEQLGGFDWRGIDNVGSKFKKEFSAGFRDYTMPFVIAQYENQLQFDADGQPILEEDGTQLTTEVMVSKELRLPSFPDAQDILEDSPEIRALLYSDDASERSQGDIAFSEEIIKRTLGLTRSTFHSGNGKRTAILTFKRLPNELRNIKQLKDPSNADVLDSALEDSNLVAVSPEFDEKYTRNGDPYVPADNQIKTWDELTAAMKFIAVGGKIAMDSTGRKFYYDPLYKGTGADYQARSTFFPAHYLGKVYNIGNPEEVPYALAGYGDLYSENAAKLFIHIKKIEDAYTTVRHGSIEVEQIDARSRYSDLTSEEEQKREIFGRDLAGKSAQEMTNMLHLNQFELVELAQAYKGDIVGYEKHIRNMLIDLRISTLRYIFINHDIKPWLAVYMDQVANGASNVEFPRHEIVHGFEGRNYAVESRLDHGLLSRKRTVVPSAKTITLDFSNTRVGTTNALRLIVCNKDGIGKGWLRTKDEMLEVARIQDETDVFNGFDWGAFGAEKLGLDPQTIKNANDLIDTHSYKTINLEQGGAKEFDWGKWYYYLASAFNASKARAGTISKLNVASPGAYKGLDQENYGKVAKDQDEFIDAVAEDLGSRGFNDHGNRQAHAQDVFAMLFSNAVPHRMKFRNVEKTEPVLEFEPTRRFVAKPNRSGGSVASFTAVNYLTSARPSLGFVRNSMERNIAQNERSIFGPGRIVVLQSYVEEKPHMPVRTTNDGRAYGFDAVSRLATKFVDGVKVNPRAVEAMTHFYQHAYTKVLPYNTPKSQQEQMAEYLELREKRYT